MQYSQEHLHINIHAHIFLNTYHIFGHFLNAFSFVHENSYGSLTSVLYSEPTSMARVAWNDGWYGGNLGKSEVLP